VHDESGLLDFPRQRIHHSEGRSLSDFVATITNDKNCSCWRSEHTQPMKAFSLSTRWIRPSSITNARARYAVAGFAACSNGLDSVEQIVGLDRSMALPDQFQHLAPNRRRPRALRCAQSLSAVLIALSTRPL
jgi:hypothetical protein